MIGGRTDAAVDTGLNEGKPVRPRIGRTGILVTAVLVSALALTVSLMPFGGSKGGGVSAAQGESTDGQPVADPGPSFPSGSESGSGSGAGSGSAGSPAVADSTSRPAGNSDPEAQGESSSPAGRQGGAKGSTKSASPDCRVKYEIVSEWPDGFQAAVTVTSTKALATWSLGWTFKDGQRVGQMWDGTFIQNDSHVTATAADYNKTVAANGTFTFGFLGSWTGSNSPARNFTLNKASCQAVG
jgi:hypothetical protein